MEEFNREILEYLNDGTVMLSFVYDETINGNRKCIRKTFVHDRKNINYDINYRDIMNEISQFKYGY